MPDIRENMLNLAALGRRQDGRGLEDYREPISVEVGISRSAEGSALVKIGKTVVMAGVKLAVDKPYPDTPNEGSMMINVELLPLSNPKYESGPPSIKAVELARVVDRGIREAKAIDTKKLCITPGEKSWTVIIDLISINDDGNLYDAAGLAAMAALDNAVFPKLKEGNLPDYKEKSNISIPLTKNILPVTVFKVGQYLFVDPTQEEEEGYDGRLSVAVAADGNIAALQKGGEDTFTLEEIETMVDLAVRKAKFLREKLKSI